jgi:hypothetical protein
MKQVLSKMLEMAQRLFRASIEIVAQIVAVLRSVNIDLPRGVILCVALQLIIALSFLVAFRTRIGSPAKAVEGHVEPQQQAVPADVSVPDFPSQSEG